MEALLATALVIVLMAVAIVILGRGWPRSSRLGGYRARHENATSAPSDEAQAQEQGRAIREDDDARWRWDDPDGGDGR